MTEHRRSKWLVLAVVGAAFFMTILDVAIVNVAIPSIQKDLNIAESTVQWVITAYAITFGGFLLLGGRMSDLLGRRRIFIAGLILFTLASLTCGLANSAGVLILSRAVQGLGAAIISPAALSIVTTTFEEGPDRNKALGIWGALGGSGAAVGVLLGGVLTSTSAGSGSSSSTFQSALVSHGDRTRPPTSGISADAVSAIHDRAGTRCSSTRSRRRPTSAGDRSHDRSAHCVDRHHCLLRRLGNADRTPLVRSASFASAR
jgi:fucose permease